jgi:hypothetical protein
MAAQIKTGSDYYEYLDVVQKICGKIKSIQIDQNRIVYANYNIDICKNNLDKELKMINKLLKKQQYNLSQ